MNVLDEDDAYFLDLFVQHPNLYEEKHEFFNDPVMTRGSWGQISLAMGTTAKEAEDKWHKLLNFYLEEAALRGCEAAIDIQVGAEDKSPYDFVYNKIHLLLQSQVPATTTHRSEKVTKVPVKNRLAKITKKATDASKHLKQQLEKVSSTTQLSSNAKIGKLIEAELQRKSPMRRALKRQQLMQCILQYLNPSNS